MIINLEIIIQLHITVSNIVMKVKDIGKIKEIYIEKQSIIVHFCNLLYCLPP